ncbi:MAG TPA: hypothetical protein VMW13_07105 [Dehalococcoidales bacterium]|nr:hypothetical protein [Dehalococcoidales bacterium]
MAIAKTEQWTKEKLMELSREEVIELWKQCPAVEMTELVGEFEGVIPNAGDEERRERTAEIMYNENSRTGYWLGKAFWPISKTKGDGYNRYRWPGGKIERYMRFATEMGTSLIDGKPSLMMYYGAYQLRLLPEGQENTLTDEIRKLADGIYLGVGTAKMPDGSRSEPGHFALVGPVGTYIRADNPTEELK